MPTAPPSAIDAAPTVPSSASPVETFDAAYEAFNNWEKNELQPKIGPLVGNVYDNTVEAAEAAAVATAQAAAAAALVNAPKWVMGTNYPTDSAAWSPTDKQTYRRNAPGGVSNVDPYLDSTHGAGWTRVGGGGSASAPDFLLFAQGIF